MPQQPDHLDITVGLGFQAAAGAGAVQITVDVELQQISRRVAGTAGGFRLDAGETSCPKVETIDKGLDEPDGIFCGNVIVEGFRQQQRLRAVVTGEVRHAGFYRAAKDAGIPYIGFSHGLQDFCTEPKSLKSNPFTCAEYTCRMQA